MRLRIGETRIDTQAIDAYRVEQTLKGEVIRVFLSNGGFLCLSPRHDTLTIEEMLELLDRGFLNV
jgi:hypothetical protein